jgi:hypothetical protein
VQQTWAERAAAIYEAMQRAFYVPDRRGLYRETAARDSAVAYVWPFSRALLATLCLAGIGGLEATYRAAVYDRLRGLERYWTGSAYASAVVPPGGDVYYDDNVWIALALILCYRLGLTAELDRAQRLFSFGWAGWHRDAREPHPGGVFWVQQGVGYGLSNHDRGAGATAANAELGLHLRELIGPAVDGHDAATTMLDWVSRHLDASGNGSGPFLNAVRRDGSIDTNVWSYNQGVMLGARVLQYRVTGDVGSVRLAEAIARQTLSTFGAFKSGNHPPTFNAMCFQNMLMLHPVSHDRGLAGEMLAAMQGYAEWTWDAASGARDPSTNLFFFDDAGRPARFQDQPARLQDQGAMTQLYALLAWDPADYARLT